MLVIGMAVPLLAVALLIGWVIVLHRGIPAPPLVISESTTRITGPLTAEGYIDFFKALEEKTSPPELATDDNGFRVFVRLFGDVGDYGITEDLEFYRLQKYEKLGLDPDIPPTLVLPDTPQKVFENFYKAKGEEAPPHTTWERPSFWNGPWTLEEFPMFADWVNEVDEPLDAIAETIRKPVFFFPMLQGKASVESGTPFNLIVILLPDVQLSWEIARMFQVRANYRIGQGDIDGAIDDKLTILRLGRQIAQSGMMVQYLVGVAIEGIARFIPVGANPDHPLTAQQICRLLDGIDALPPRAPFTNALEWERYSILSAVQSLSISLTEGKISPHKWVEEIGGGNHPAWRFLSSNPRMIDWNTIYRRINKLYDAIQEPSPRTNYASMMEESESIDKNRWKTFARLLTPGSKDRVIANMFIALFDPATNAFEEAIRRSECAENMQRLTLAILLYQAEHGTLPGEDWAVQIEKYLGGNAFGEDTERYFSCPTNPTPKGETRYAMIQYGDKLPANPQTLLFIELAETVPLDKAVVTADEMLEFVLQREVVKDTIECCGTVHTIDRAVSLINAHPGGMNVAHRSGAMQFLSSLIEKAELLRLLGREEESEEQE